MKMMFALAPDALDGPVFFEVPVRCTALDCAAHTLEKLSRFHDLGDVINLSAVPGHGGKHNVLITRYIQNEHGGYDIF